MTINQSVDAICNCHPWHLDSGSPCRTDGSTTCANICYPATRLDFELCVIVLPTVNHIELLL